VASAGDLNGDGYGDVVVSSTGATESAFVYYGSANGLVASSATGLIEDGGTPRDSVEVANAGDVNGDGYSDIIIGGGPQEMKAYVYHGGPTGISTIPSTVISLPDGVWCEHPDWVEGAGDVNGDGYADVLVSCDRGVVHVYVYEGGPNGVSTSPASILIPSDAATMKGFGGMTGFDVNGDGFWDVAVGVPGVNIVWIFMGSHTGELETPVASVTNGGETNCFGLELSGGDVDGDG
jgi:hypothetical protein